jgi:thioredoxin reductase/Pyruvate/2-oxoacid:ferredoxin oxidoreductase delta subunit
MDFLNMEILIEQIAVYTLILGFCLGIVIWYLRNQKQNSSKTESKIVRAKEDGLYEPVSLHPVIDVNTCIKSGACIVACPEKDILGIVNGRATLVNASLCIGHGACFHACPVEAISLVIGTEKRGIDLPHVNENFESNVPGIFIAGELGGMGLIKNSVEQGQSAVEYIAKSGIQKEASSYDLVIIGAGPAGIGATLMAHKHKLNSITLEQDTLGGTVFTFPRSKIVMTAPMDLPLYGKVKLYDTSKTELLELWNEVLGKNNITIREKTKVEEITSIGNGFEVIAKDGKKFNTKKVLIAIGRRGSPRKLNVPGEATEKVAYRLLEPENINDKDIMVVGGGDSAIESALLLAENNRVSLSYRGDKFKRLKVKNREKIEEAIATGSMDVLYNTNIVSIEKEQVLLSSNADDQIINLKNDKVYIFAGGELPTQFLMQAGIKISKRFGYTLKTHK